MRTKREYFKFPEILTSKSDQKGVIMGQLIFKTGE